MDVFEKVKKIIGEHLDVSEGSITLKTTFEDLDADSLDVVEMVMALEEEFDLEISDEDVEKIQSVGEIVSYIERHVS